VKQHAFVLKALRQDLGMKRMQQFVKHPLHGPPKGFQMTDIPGFKIVGFAGQPLPS
jgi:hypothetical protein